MGTDCFVGTNGVGIETYSGIAFPLDGEIPLELIRLEDIAHALSMTCRYAGHCKFFYSVAEHSVRVFQHLLRHNYPESTLRSALLHDAAEAYVGDVTRPLKALLPGYREIEDRIQDAIYLRFDAAPRSEEARLAIKAADNAVLRAEARVLMPSRGELWAFGDIEESDVRIIGWSSPLAEAAFLKACRTRFPAT